MPTRRSSFGADCAHCGKELIAPERSEYRDERHVLHIWRCPKCDRDKVRNWYQHIFDCLIDLNKHQGRDGETHHHNYDGRVPAMPLSDRVKLTALIAGCLFGAWGVVVELHRAPCQGSKGLFGRLLSAALYLWRPVMRTQVSQGPRVAISVPASTV